MVMMLSGRSLIIGSVFIIFSKALSLLDNEDGGLDLARYISRPDIRAPWLELTTYEADEVTPGYWFTAPYAELMAKDLTPEYLPYQGGPHIYDHRGELVWSGSPWAQHSNVYDFRMAEVNGSKVLSGLMGATRQGGARDEIGFILDNSYQIIHKVDVATDFNRHFNQHEFNIIADNRVLIATAPWTFMDLRDIGDPKHGCTIMADGFREYDLTTKKNIIEWSPLSHIRLNESFIPPPPNYNYEWDSYHLNSITKDNDGDYIISMRHTSAVYKISHINNTILWRLGGKLSDFQQDFNFSSQHHVRILSQDTNTTTISLFDNSADDSNRQPATAETSTVKIIRLYTDTRPYRAKLLNQFARPDGGLTDRRGSAQILSNNHAFISWSHNGYISEHTPSGKVVLEAKYAGNRFSTYRAYHADKWVGRPLELPSLVSHVYGGAKEAITLIHVSWNGATEVRKWRFYGARHHGVETGTVDVFEEIGSVVKVSFESSLSVEGVWGYVYAEAVDVEGKVIGRSDAVEAELGDGWESEDVEKLDRVAAGRFFGSRSDVGRVVSLICVLYTVGSLLLWCWRRNRTQTGWRRGNIWASGSLGRFDDDELIAFSRRASGHSGADHAEDGLGIMGEKQVKML